MAQASNQYISPNRHKVLPALYKGLATQVTIACIEITMET
jgi:hypothetical protein